MKWKNVIRKVATTSAALSLGIVSAQNVGIGTAAPQDKLHVAGNLRVDGLAGVGTRMVGVNSVGTLLAIGGGVNGQVMTQTGGGPAWQTAFTDWHITGNVGTNATTNFVGTADNVDFVLRTSSNERVRILSTGSVGIGTGSPMEMLHVNGDIRIGVISPINTGSLPSYGNKLNFSGGNAGPYWDSDNSDPIWIARYNLASDDSELRLSLGDNCSPGDAFVITAGVGCQNNSTIFRFEGDGTARKPGGGSWLGWSDRRLKKEIARFYPGLEIVQELEPVTFQYNGLGETADNGKEYVGVIAQEVQKLAPYMVDSTGEYLSVDPSAFTFILINAVQEQQAQINALMATEKRLMTELDRIRAMLGQASMGTISASLTGK